MLTERQKTVLDFIQREQREKGITPSTREIQSHFGFASQTSVMQYIAALERKGFLDRHARKARTLITPAESQNHRYSNLRADPGGHVGADRTNY
jgi:repressor LexA